MTLSHPTAIILAAGKGTRMQSVLPKVLHKIAGAPMLAYALSATRSAGVEAPALVVGPAMGKVADAAKAFLPALPVFVQAEQRGTADAVLAAKPAIEAASGPVLILYGDTPLLQPDTLKAVSDQLNDGADLAVVGFHAPDPRGYGRLLLDDADAPAGIREERDASEAERSITLCNSGIMGFRSGGVLLALLAKIGKDNAKGEYYLTDAVALGAKVGLSIRLVMAPSETVLGVNSRAELAAAEAIIQQRLRKAAMHGGATLIAPETVFFSYDTRIGRDVVIEPNVFFAPGVTIEDGATVKAFCHLEGATIGRGATVGPFARLRPGARLAEKAHIGNFVEIKQADIGPGAKVNHLTYIGDASIGAEANIGAGTITCNYDGFDKHRTEIGKGAFIGSNSALVAPVKVGDGAYVGSGSVIVRNVSPGALAVSRPAQEERADWAARFRARRAKGKAPDTKAPDAKDPDVDGGENHRRNNGK